MEITSKDNSFSYEHYLRMYYVPITVFGTENIKSLISRSLDSGRNRLKKKKHNNFNKHVKGIVVVKKKKIEKEKKVESSMNDERGGSSGPIGRFSWSILECLSFRKRRSTYYQHRVFPAFPFHLELKVVFLVSFPPLPS